MSSHTSVETESYSAFRTRLLIDTILPTFVFPPLLCAVLLRTLSTNVIALSNNTFLKFSAYIISIPICLLIRIQIRRRKQRLEAQKLGARLVPRVRGKWPGNLDILLDIMNSPQKFYIMDGAKEIMENSGSNTININILWVDQYFTMDEGVVKFMLATGFDHFDKGVAQKERLEDLMGNGIFNRDGEIWKKHRATARPYFARERVVDFEHFERFTHKSLDILSQFGPSDPVDVQDLFARFTLDTASAFLFNTNLDTLSLPLPKAYEAKLGPKGSAIEGSFGTFATAFEEAQQIASARTRRRALWKLFEFFHNASDAPVKVIRDYLDPLVHKVLEEKAEYMLLGKDKPEDSSDSFLRYLAISTDNVTMIREELLNILLASRDTTASLLTSVVYFLSQHPDIMKILRSEILRICPNRQIPSYDDIRQLRYLRAVLNETMRLFPPVPANARVSREASAIPVNPGEGGDPRPLYIPADTEIVYFPVLIHKRKDLWGPDADIFDPNRWLDDGTGRLERMVKNPLMFAPFNAGPRICLGQQFALNEASFFLVRLLQVYDRFELALDAQPRGSLPPPEWSQIKDSRASMDKVWIRSSVTLYIKGGLWVKLHKVENNPVQII